jgi:hypothetical protein
MTPRPTTRSDAMRRRRLTRGAALGAASIAVVSGVASLAGATTFPWHNGGYNPPPQSCPQSPPQSGPQSPPQSMPQSGTKCPDSGATGKPGPTVTSTAS